MIKFWQFGVVAMAASLSVPAISQDREEPEAQEEPTNAEEAAQPEDGEELEKPGDRIICRRERVTGSLTRVNRICMTRDEWNGVADRTRDAHNSTVRGASGSQCIPDNPLRPSC